MVQREPDTGGGIAAFLFWITVGITVLGLVAFFASLLLMEPRGAVYGYQPVIIAFAVPWGILVLIVGLILFNSRRKSDRM